MAQYNFRVSNTGENILSPAIVQPGKPTDETDDLLHIPSNFKGDPSEGSLNDKDYFGIIEETYGKRFFRMGNGQLVKGDIFLKIGDTILVADYGPYDGTWEVVGVTQFVDKTIFTTRFSCRRLTNVASNNLQADNASIKQDYIIRKIDEQGPEYVRSQETVGDE